MVLQVTPYSMYIIWYMHRCIWVPLTVTTLAERRDGVKRLVFHGHSPSYNPNTAKYCCRGFPFMDPMRWQTCHPLEPSFNTGPSRLSLNILQIMLDCCM